MIRISIKKRPLIALKVGAKIVNTGGGAVDSVNGQTGAVNLTADNIPETSTRFWLTDVLKAAYDGAVTALSALLMTGERLITSGEITKLSNTSGTNTGDQTITLTGDVTGSGTGIFAISKNCYIKKRGGIAAFLLDIKTPHQRIQHRKRKKGG